MKFKSGRLSIKSRSAYFLILLGLSLSLLLFMQSCSREKIPEPTPTRLPTLAPEFVDSSWFTDEPCQAPCWYGLQLGKSTFEETIIIAENLSFIEYVKKAQYDYVVWDTEEKIFIPSESYKGICVQPEGKGCVRFEFVDNILREMALVPMQYYPIDFLVEAIGPPDNIYVEYSYPETNAWCTVMLFWEDRDTLVKHNDKPEHWYEDYIEFPGHDLCKAIWDNDYKIPKTLSVDSIYYEAELLLHYENSRMELREWNGFLGE